MRHAIAASKWRFLMLSAPLVAAEATGCISTSSIVKQRAYKSHLRGDNFPAGKQRRREKVTHHQASTNNTEWRGSRPQGTECVWTSNNRKGRGDVGSGMPSAARSVSRFSHRHGASSKRPLGHQSGSNAPVSAAQHQPHEGGGEEEGTLLTSFEHLLKVHLAMRSNYEALQQSQQVVTSFSVACVRALMQLGLLLPDRRGFGEGGCDVRVSVSGVDAPVGHASASDSLFITYDSPLYTTLIGFPPPPLEAMLKMTGSPDLNPSECSGDMLLEEMDTASSQIKTEKGYSANSSSSSSIISTATDAAATISEDAEGIQQWHSAVSGMESVASRLQRFPISDILQLVETVAYFKWVKDEEVLEWRKGGSLAPKLLAEIAAIHASATEGQKVEVVSAQHSIGTRSKVETKVKLFIDRIPRIDRLAVVPEKTVAVAEPSANADEPCAVHVIDVMLNVLMRICLHRWCSLTFGEKTTLVLFFTFPWFVRDLSVEAASWLTYCNLQTLRSEHNSISYHWTFHYVRRLLRLCWPSIHDMDSSPVQKLFVQRGFPPSVLLKATTPLANGVAVTRADATHVGPTEGGEEQKPHQPTGESDVRGVDAIPSFRDLICVLYGSAQKQRVAYELLLLWLTRANPTSLHSTSPHSRYISAIGIAIADADHFLTERFHKDHLEGNWIFLRAPNCSDAASAAVERLTKSLYTPHLLTRLFFTGFHGVLPHIWQALGTKRKKLLWVAWLRSVSRPIVDVATAQPASEDNDAVRFVDPLLSILSADVMFLRFVTRLVIISLTEMSFSETGEPIDVWCERLIEVVYTGALVLRCNGNSTEKPCDTAASVMEGKILPNLPSPQQQQPAVMAIRRSFKEAVRVLLQRMGSEHVQVAHRLLDALFEPLRKDVVGSGVLHDIQKEVLNICDDESHEMVRDWVSRRALVDQEMEELVEEPLLCEWQRAVRDSDAGLPIQLPTLVECCRGVLRLLKSRGHHLFSEDQIKRSQERGQQPELGQSEVVADISNGVESPMEVFTASELQLILTTLSRAVLSRTQTLNALGLTSISHEIAAISTALNREAGDGSRRGHDLQATAVVVDTAVGRAVLLEKVLSSEVASKARILPWSSLFEAVQLQLAPYSILQVSYDALQEGQKSNKTRCQKLMQAMEKNILLRFHHRFVGGLVFFRYYHCVVPHDCGWMDSSVPQCGNTSKKDAGVDNAGDGGVGIARAQDENHTLQQVTWQLMIALVRAEEVRKKQKSSVNDTVSTDAVRGRETRLEQLGRILACHALVAYMRLASHARGSSSVRETYGIFIHLSRDAAAHISSPHNEGDLLFLWLAATATALGVRYHPPVTFTWPGVGTEMPPESDGVAQCVSLEGETMRAMCAIAPHVQNECLRANPRLKFIANTLVAIQTFGKLGVEFDAGSLHMDRLLLRMGTDRRLLHRHLNLFIVSCSALPGTRHAFLSTAAYLREVRNVLSPCEIERALVAITLSAEAFAKHHEKQLDLQQQSSMSNASQSTAFTMRVTPTQLRHAWSALSRRVLECADEVETNVLVKALHCAGAVACVDTLVCQQLFSFLVEFRQEDLSLLDWAVILRTARQSMESRRGLVEYLQDPMRDFLLSMDRQNDRKRAWMQQRGMRADERLMEDLCHFVEALPEMFVGDKEFWTLLRRAIAAQWIMCFEGLTVGSQHQEQQQQPRAAMWLKELGKSYAWAVRTAGHHNLSEIPILPR